MPRYADDQWRVMLNMLAVRDAPVELSRRNAQDDTPPIVYRSRLFEVTEEGHIVVERPSQVVIDKTMSDGDDIELLLMHNGDRLIATCTILDTHLRWINSDVRVTCYRLSPGRRPQRDQRRSFYRVSVAAQPLEPVLLEGDPEQGAFSVEGQLVNLSGGGFGVSLRSRNRVIGKVKRTRSFNCTANFGEGETVQVPVRVAHIEARGDDLLYLGLAVEIEDEAAVRALEDRLLHLCAYFQRAQLQKRKA